jgi:hypothetical protein
MIQGFVLLPGHSKHHQGSATYVCWQPGCDHFAVFDGRNEGVFVHDHRKGNVESIGCCPTMLKESLQTPIQRTSVVLLLQAVCGEDEPKRWLALKEICLRLPLVSGSWAYRGTDSTEVHQYAECMLPRYLHFNYQPRKGGYRCQLCHVPEPEFRRLLFAFFALMMKMQRKNNLQEFRLPLNIYMRRAAADQRLVCLGSRRPQRELPSDISTVINAERRKNGEKLVNPAALRGVELERCLLEYDQLKTSN